MHLYLIQDQHSKQVKIGKSVTPEKRERTLLPLAPALQLMCYWLNAELPAKNGYLYNERFWHKRFEKFRGRGEWFRLEPNHISHMRWFLLGKLARVDVVDFGAGTRLQEIETSFRMVNRYRYGGWRWNGKEAEDVLPEVITEMEWHEDGQLKFQPPEYDQRLGNWGSCSPLRPAVQIISDALM